MRRARDGFTIVELIITLVVMVILTGLSIVIVGDIQAQARDSERQQDVEAIARGLEQYYKQGNPKTLPGYSTKGNYPGLNIVLHMGGLNDYSNGTPGHCSAIGPCDSTNTRYILEALPGVTEENLKGPKDGEDFTPAWGMPNQADRDAKLDSYVYLYTAYYSNGGLCYDGLPVEAPCTRFTLQYKKETGSQEIVTIKSRHQQ